MNYETRMGGVLAGAGTTGTGWDLVWIGALGAIAGCQPSAPAMAPTPSGGATPRLSAEVALAPKNSLAIVVSGGVSLGAYQGGYLYALSEELKQEHVRPDLYVGASAGTINALLLGIEMCHPPVPDPDASPLRSVWMRASLAQLRKGSVTTSPTAVFPQDGVREIAQTIRSRLGEGMTPGCDFVVAAETSRIRPRPVKIDENETVPDIQEPFTVRITVGDDGRAQIHNYVTDDDASPAQAFLPFPQEQADPRDQEAAIDLLIDLVLASSAFPGAFPQVDLPHCMSDPDHRALRTERAPGDTRPPTECGRLTIHEHTPFADGGILDNTPIGLAIETARRGWSPEGRRWVEPRTPEPNGKGCADAGAGAKCDRGPRGFSYLLVNTDNDAYDPLPTPRFRLSSFLSFAATFLGAFVDAGRGRALYDTVEQFPELQAHIAISGLHVRLASQYLFAFFGFLDTRLRDFDFVGGMYDASLFVERGRLAHLLAGEPQPADSSSAAQGRVAAGLARRQQPSGVWQELACLADAYDPSASSPRCAAGSPTPNEHRASPPWEPLGGPNATPDFVSFVALAQASLDVLYSQCLCAEAVARTKKEQQLGPACVALLQSSRTPPRFSSGIDPGDGWQQQCTLPPNAPGGAVSVEDPFEYAARRLAHYGFAGASLGESMQVVRARLGTLADDLVTRQPGLERPLEGLGSPVALDAAFSYRPALHSVHGVGGPSGAEAGYSFGRWIRIATALQLKGWEGGKVAVTPLAGVDWNLPLGSALVQAHLFARGGFQFSNVVSDDVASPCMGGFGGHPGRCLVGQVGIAATLLELFRLQSVWEESPAPFGNPLDHLLVELGFQLNWPPGGH